MADDSGLIERINAIGDRLENGQRAQSSNLVAYMAKLENASAAQHKFVAQALGKIADRLGNIESTVDALGGRVDKLEHTSASMRANLYDVVATITARVGVLETQVNRLAAKVAKSSRPSRPPRKKK